MKYVHSIMDIRVADMDIGSLWAGSGLSARTVKSVCPCCHKTLIGDDCKHEPVPVDVRKNAPPT